MFRYFLIAIALVMAAHLTANAGYIYQIEQAAPAVAGSTGNYFDLTVTADSPTAPIGSYRVVFTSATVFYPQPNPITLTNVTDQYVPQGAILEPTQNNEVSISWQAYQSNGLSPDGPDVSAGFKVRLGRIYFDVAANTPDGFYAYSIADGFGFDSILTDTRLSSFGEIPYSQSPDPLVIQVASVPTPTSLMLICFALVLTALVRLALLHRSIPDATQSGIC